MVPVVKGGKFKGKLKGSVKLWNLQLQKEVISAQAVKIGAALKTLGCEIKSGSQEMAAIILMLINFNNGCVHC